MSYESGWKAINLEFSGRVPRTEYSAHQHWPLVKKVTGIDTNIEENREKAVLEFFRIWDYAFLWSTPTPIRKFMKETGWYTSMGHAEYAAGGEDFNTEIHCPFKTLDDVYNFDPLITYGEMDKDDLVRELNNIYYKNKKLYGKITLTMGGVYHTIFSGFIDMLGWEMFLTAMGQDPEAFDRLTERYFRWVKQFYQAWAKTDCKVFMCHDDICWSSGPVNHPQWYRKCVFPRYKKLWQPLLEAGKKIIFTSDGKYDMFFDDLVECGAHMLVMEPGNDMEGFAKKYGKTHGFVGNADTRILLSGTKEDIYREVKRCIDTGKEYPGFIMAVGNHIPSNTPVDNALYYNDAYMELSAR
jgi:hypothetical protein